jgi:hypothetical protein
MTFRPDLDPGSEEARAEGCICDPDQDSASFTVEKACPIHGLAELKAMLDEEGS